MNLQAATRQEIPAYEPFPASLPFARFTRWGDLVYVSGHIPDAGGSIMYRGRLGADISIAEGQQAARQATLGVLSALRGAVDLDDVVSVVRLTGYVASTPDFVDQPAVVNAASELLHDVFGTAAALHARSAIGVATLPLGAPVEIEAIFGIGTTR